MNIQHIIKHLFTSGRAARRLFPDTALQAIQATIAAGEKRHNAEVRIAIEAALPFTTSIKGQSTRARAHELFSLHRIWDTEDNCGILLYINLAARKVEIVADRNVGKALSRDQWQTICQTVTTGFAVNIFQGSVIKALEQMNDFLAQHFPAQGKHHNQLSNRPLVL